MGNTFKPIMTIPWIGASLP